LEQSENHPRLCTDFIRNLADKMIEWGAGLVVFKLGTFGIYMRTAGKERLNQLGAGAPQDTALWANREIWSPIFEIDQFIGTTGAADSAIAGFITALLRSVSPEKTLMFACAVGACNVEAADALSGLLTYEETLTRIEKGWKRLPVGFSEPGWRLHPASQTWLGPFDSQS
jgi:sugar/nucleoside kinase (ribokinase family)